MTRLAVRSVLLLTVAVIAAFQTYRVFHRHRSYGEGPIVAFAERMRSEPISEAWMHEPPYTLSCYGPAYYWATNVVADLGGWHNSLIPGRLVSLVAALTAAGLAAAAAWRHTRNIDLGLLAAILFLVSLPVNEWLPYARVDMLAIAFSAAAYLAVGTHRWELGTSALLIVVGSLVKPTVALTALPIAAHLLITRRHRDAVFYVSIVIVAGALAWGVVQWASRGYFLTAVLLGNRNPLYLWRSYLYTHQFLISPLAVGALGVVAWRLIASPQQFVRSLFGLGFVSSLAIAIVLVGKRGSEINYFLEPALLAGLAIAVDGAAWLSMLDANRTRLAVGLLSVVLAVPNVREIRQQFRAPAKESPSYETARHWLSDEPADADLLADGRMVDVALAAGRRPWLNDSFLYMLLVDNGTLDSAPLMERLRDGRIKWLLLRKTIAEHQEAIESKTDCWPLEVIESFPRFYELVDESDGLYVYRHGRFGDSVACATCANAGRAR